MEQVDQKLLIATNNRGKLAELADLLAGMRVDLVSLADFPEIPDVEETGRTFDDNARLKAGTYALKTGLMALADDSGLEVEALDNRPGVFSARYGGALASYPDKMKKLLGELAATGDKERRARFVTAIAVADPGGEILFTAEGVCAGTIAQAPRGFGGFGYDPLFVPDGYEMTFGELSAHVKRKISHRARAFQQIIPFLRDFIAI
jgi:XTP/dITP diphosphohydrolase